MYVTIGFSGACALCCLKWGMEGLWYFAAIAVLLSLGLCFASRSGKWPRKLAAVMLGIGMGFAWFQLYSAFYLSSAVALDGQTRQITAQCSDYGYETGYGTGVDTVVWLEGKPYQVRLYFKGNVDFSPGDYVKGEFRFRVTTPGGEADSSQFQTKGIFLLGYQKSDATLAAAEEIPWYFGHVKLRHQILSLIDDCFPKDTAGFAKALLIGDRSDLEYETIITLKIAGIMHIVAVSGLHVSILFGLIHNVSFRKRIFTALLGIPLLILFAAISGFSPSVTRACVMQILMILAMLFEREYDGPTELAFSVLVMLVCNPLLIASASLQMSAACVAGLFLFQRRIYCWLREKLGHSRRKFLERVGDLLVTSISVTLGAMSLSTPLAAYYFGIVSLVGILTNLLTLWAVTLIFYGIMLVCVLGTFWVSGAVVLGQLVSVLIRYVLLVAEILAEFPLAAVYTRNIYGASWLVFVYILLAVFLTSKRKHTGTLICCGALGLCLALAASWIEPMTDDCRMTVLDVGQGQSIILQSEGKTYLVDCGGSEDEKAADLAAETLMSQGVFRLDGIIVTHYDRDHAGGLPYLMTRMPTDTLFLPDALDEAGVGDGLAKLTEGNVIYVSENLSLSFGQTELTIFGPVASNSDNESSLAVLFQAGECDILITGDRSDFGERMLMRDFELPKLEILVAGHHGAKGSTGVELLEATKPAIVAISVGENYYGHPSDELLARLADYGCLVYRTDLNGNLIFRR